jgi:hypothetical protein
MVTGSPPAKKWYLAILVVASRVDDEVDRAPLIDMQYKLIHAIDADAAYLRAVELGARENHDYKNDAGAQVQWEFVGLNDLCEIEDDDLDDGVEVYSQMSETDPREWVRPKEELQVFWNEANKHRTASEIMEEANKHRTARDVTEGESA